MTAPVVDMLSRLGWDVETAEQAGLTGKINDTKWVVHARKHGRIAITFDELRGEQGADVSRELRLRGGKVIRVQGGPEQSPYRALGRLLYHYPEWHPSLSENDGVSILSDTKHNCSNHSPEQFHHKCHRIDAEQFTEYLAARKTRRPHRKRRGRRPPPPQQMPFSPP